MNQPAPTPGIAAARARSGSAWWSARASLAVRRTRRFAIRWALGLGTLTILLLLAPFLARDPRAGDRVRLDRLAADTLRSAQRVRVAQGSLASAESLLAEARSARRSAIAQSSGPRDRERTASPRPVDPAFADFTRLLDDARRARNAETALALSAHPAIGTGPRVRALADSIRAMEARRASPDSGAGEAALEQGIARVVRSVIAIAEFRRAELAVRYGDSSAVAAPPPQAQRDTVASAPIDTVPLLGRLTAVRDTLGRAQVMRDSLVAAMRALERSDAPLPSAGMSRFSPALLTLVVLLVGLAMRFVSALRQEAGTPTLADASEAERVTGIRALTTVKDAPLEGPARFKPSGVDPFRMLYLSLTATGTRARTAVVAGADAEITASVGARLAIAAAADHRNTLVVDLDPTQIALSRAFRERAEPGLSDVLARAFTWREVARPVGSSDGLPITLLPAGTERDDGSVGEQRQSLLSEFARFRAGYELTLAVTPIRHVALALGLIEASPILLAVVIGETTVAALIRQVEELRSAGLRIQGLVLWDAPRPTLPSRGELVALLSKRKGRTPGGSFEAVQRVINQDIRNNKRP